MTSKVILKKCPDYSTNNVTTAIKYIFDELKLSEFIKPGTKVLLKPNLLMAFTPDKGVTTNPEIVKAVAFQVQELGGIVIVGDSPGGVGAMYDKVLKDTQIKDLGLTIVNFEDKGMRKIDNPKGIVNPILLSNTIFDADIIINLPKMKTHELTKITVGIKNLFGCVPGLHKVSYHLETPDPVDFASALVDVFEIVKPAVTIVDAVVSMQGSGPSNGTLISTGYIFGSKDTVAVDAVASVIMNLDPLHADTTRIAAERGLGKANMDEIEIFGDILYVFKEYIPATGTSPLKKKLPRWLLGLLKPLIKSIETRPKINNKKCIKCNMCVRSCPTKAIDPIRYKIDDKKCIMCFCCRELCKYDAVERKESLLWKLLKRRTN